MILWDQDRPGCNKMFNNLPLFFVNTETFMLIYIVCHSAVCYLNNSLFFAIIKHVFVAFVLFQFQKVRRSFMF